MIKTFDFEYLLIFFEDNVLVIPNGYGALLVTKAFACLCGLILYVTETHRPLAVAAGTYIGLALFPWVMLLAAVR